MGPLLMTCLVLGALVTWPHRGEARAEGQAVLLVAPPENLSEATATALASWNLQVRSLQAQIPSESMPGARDAAAVLADEQGARALVWITENQDGPALWLYDAEDDRVVVRRLSAYFF